MLDKEIAARRAVETAAEARRALPAGGELPEDYTFHQVDDAGVRRPVRLSDLFGANDTLLLYSYMFGPDADPCPMCTPLLDGLNGVEDHIRQRASLAVRHFWGSELAHGPEDPGQHHRGLDILNPVFNAFDLTPQGRSDWTTQVAYGDPDAVDAG